MAYRIVDALFSLFTVHAARSQGNLDGDTPCTFQVKDDHKPIMLMKPIEVIRKELSGIN